jgi:hypothetical protein
MKRVLSALCTLAVAAAFSAGPVAAVDEASVAMNGKILIIKNAKLAKFISKPVTPATFPLPTDPSNFRLRTARASSSPRSAAPAS